MPRKKNRNLEAARSRMYRELVFECAERLFAERGYEATTIQEIAEEAGISLKTLYGAFPGKAEIYEAIVTTRGRAFLEATRAAERGVGSGLERLEASVRAIVDFLVKHDDFRRILIRQGRAWGLDPGSEAERGPWLEGIAEAADIVRQGIAEGVFHDEDPELQAITVFSVLQVQLAGRIDRSRGKPDAAALAAQLLLQMRRLLCRDPEAAAPQPVA
jgi:AcrR family transcriptional regulator